MRLYHGSDCEVRSPDVAFSRRSVDFGRGFYLTSFEDQAARWARRKAMRSHGEPILNVYDCDMQRLESFEVKTFEAYDREWLDFVCACRKPSGAPHDYDIVIGPVANDRVFEAVNMYFQELWDAQSTLDALAFYERNDQFCFASQHAIDELLIFEGTRKVDL